MGKFCKYCGSELNDETKFYPLRRQRQMCIRDSQ